MHRASRLTSACSEGALWINSLYVRGIGASLMRGVSETTVAEFLTAGAVLPLTRQSVHLVSMPALIVVATFLPLLTTPPLVALSQQDTIPGVRVHTGLIYSTAGNRSLKLDLYLPKDGSAPFAAIVLIPGERSPDRLREQYRELAKLAVTRGELAVAIIEHRTVHEAHYPGAIDDARAAVRWLRSHAAEYRINPRQIGAAGDNFGGYVASLLALDRQDSASAVQAVAAISPVTDLESYSPPPDGYPYHYALFLRYPRAQRPELWRAASPLTHVRAPGVPFLLLRGSRDNASVAGQSAILRDALLRVGAQVELTELADAANPLLLDERARLPVMRNVVRFLSRALWEPPPGVVVDADKVYASPDGRDLHLDVFSPASSGSRRPAIVFVHGGGWLWGNKRDHWPTAAYFASRGFVTAAVEYRLAREHVYPAALEDVRAAVAWLRANAAPYGIDPRRIGAVGSSAGGHLAAMLGVVPDTSQEKTPPVQAVAAIAAPVDLALQHERDRFGPALFVGAGNPTEHAERWRAASPITHVNKRAAPFLFLHGTADELVLIAEAEEMARRLRAAGLSAEVHAAERGPHDFFLEQPWRAPALRRIEDFFGRTLK